MWFESYPQWSEDGKTFKMVVMLNIKYTAGGVWGIKTFVVMFFLGVWFGRTHSYLPRCFFVSYVVNKACGLGHSGDWCLGWCCLSGGALWDFFSTLCSQDEPDVLTG